MTEKFTSKRNSISQSFTSTINRKSLTKLYSISGRVTVAFEAFIVLTIMRHAKNLRCEPHALTI